MFLETIDHFTSGDLTAEVVQARSDGVLTYAVALIRRPYDTRLGEFLLTADPGQLDDLIHVLGRAAGLIDQLLGGQPGDAHPGSRWFDRAAA